MKTFLVLIIAFCSASMIFGQCPSFVFFSQNPLRCEGRVDLEIHPCPASVTAPYTIDYVELNLGDGTIVTTNGLEYTHFYQTSGYKFVTGVVHCTVNGVSCAVNVIGYGSTPDPLDPYSFDFGGSNPAEMCAHTQLVYHYDVNVYLGNASVFVESPLQPSAIYSNTLVDIGASYNQLLNLPSTYNSTIMVDGAIVSTLVSATAPTNILTDYLFTTGQHVIELSCIDSRTEHMDYTIDQMTYCGVTGTLVIDVIDSSVIEPCSDCFTFRPDQTKRYWLSAWVKEDVASQVKTYTNTSVKLTFNGSGAAVTTLAPTGEIIDGWQRIAGEFTVPANTTSIDIKLNNAGSIAAYFDDIRVHPFNASMKSYVNDPATFWLTAELDDNNYATFYEYDKEGKLIRIKKETAKGIMTIQESRTSNPKTN